MKQFGLVNRDSPILIHGKEHLRTSQTNIQRMHSLCSKIGEHPHYSLDMPFTDYHLYK